jgi:hypothetical protein
MASAPLVSIDFKRKISTKGADRKESQKEITAQAIPQYLQT